LENACAEDQIAANDLAELEVPALLTEDQIAAIDRADGLAGELVKHEPSGFGKHI
jgi:hypothetical protein